MSDAIVDLSDHQADLHVITQGNQHPWVSRTRHVPKPWGHEEIFALVPGKYCGKALHVTASQSLSLQYHENKDEVIAVQSGRVLLEIGPDDRQLSTIELRPGDSVHVPPGVRHRITAVEDAVLLEASTTELADVVRLEDRYGRTGTNP